MMGRHHAVSGIVTGLAVAPAIGLATPGEWVPFTVAVAGYALLPDLDCGSATASRLLGPATGVLSRGLKWCSERLYAVTKGLRDEDWTGGHRHMTHCAVFALAVGALAWWTSSLSPWAVAGWLGFGVLAAQATLGEWALLTAAAAVVPALMLGGDPLALLTGMQGWIAVAVALGCITHDLGDALTLSGVPLLWPIPIAGETWYEVRTPAAVRFRTGSGAETCVAVVLVVGAVLLLPPVRHNLDNLPGWLSGTWTRLTAAG